MNTTVDTKIHEVPADPAPPKPRPVKPKEVAKEKRERHKP